MRPVILFDGVCNLCNHAIDFVLKHESGREFLFAASQSEAGRLLMERFGLSEADVNRSIYVVDDGRLSSKSTAALNIARRMRAPWKWAYVFIAIPGPLRDPFYNLVARNRYRWFGKRSVCRLPTQEERDRFLDPSLLSELVAS